MRQSVRDIATAMPNAKGYLIAHTNKLLAAEEHNWSLTSSDLFTCMVRAWITEQPLPAALQPLQ
jgi:hypothetical protein